jgi:hypothetical protein
MESLPQRKADLLVWTCDVCEKPIDDGDGYLGVDHAAVSEHESAVWAWEKRVREKSTGPLFIYCAGELRDYPKPAAWRALHRRCDPEPDAPAYFFGIERIRRAAHVIWWAAHLLEKNWITSTNWNDVLRACAKQFEELEA